MNKTELVAAIAEKTEMSKKDSERALSAILDTIAAALKAGDNVRLIGFGTFEVKERDARVGRNPSTGKEIRIPASRVPAFKAGKDLKETVNVPKSKSKAKPKAKAKAK